MQFSKARFSRSWNHLVLFHHHLTLLGPQSHGSWQGYPTCAQFWIHFLIWMTLLQRNQNPESSNDDIQAAQRVHSAPVLNWHLLKLLLSLGARDKSPRQEALGTKGEGNNKNQEFLGW